MQIPCKYKYASKSTEQRVKLLRNAHKSRYNFSSYIFNEVNKIKVRIPVDRAAHYLK